MFWFFAVYICIFEAFWYLWLILVCPSLKKSKPANPLIVMGSLCCGFKTCMPQAGLLRVKVQLVLPVSQEVMYLQVLTVGILWIVIDMSHLKQHEKTLTTAGWSSPALNPFSANTSDGFLLPSPAWLVSCCSAGGVDVGWAGAVLALPEGAMKCFKGMMHSKALFVMMFCL